MRTLDDGTLCSTYKEAALRRDLLESDTEWESCLSEASLSKMPSQLRHLFSIILVFGSPAEPGKLWDKHKHALCEDFQYRRYGITTTDLKQDVINTALLEIDHHLQIHGKHLCDYEGLPEVQEEEWHTSPHTSKIIQAFTSFSPQEENKKATHNLHQMNPEQRAVYDEIISATENPNTAKNMVFFLDGPGGTGKTFTYNTIAAYLRSKGKIVLTVKERSHSKLETSLLGLSLMSFQVVFYSAMRQVA